MFPRLAVALLLRRHLRALDAIAGTLAAQQALLTRLTEHFAPLAIPSPDRQTLFADSGLTHLDETEAGLAAAFIERTEQATGHTPDDEEVTIYLADEKTIDLHKRLIERDAELARLAESRR